MQAGAGGPAEGGGEGVASRASPEIRSGGRWAARPTVLKKGWEEAHRAEVRPSAPYWYGTSCSHVHPAYTGPYSGRTVYGPLTWA
jgi:hypothetical protein